MTFVSPHPTSTGATGAIVPGTGAGTTTQRALSLPDWLTATIAVEFARPLPTTVQRTSARDRDTRLTHALHMIRVGMEEAGFTIVFDLIKRNPGWEQGHVTLAQLLAQSGARAAFDLFLSSRVTHSGPHHAVMTACLRMLSDAGHHRSIQALLPSLRERIGPHVFFTMLDALAASETGDLERADALFAQVLDDGARLSLPYITHLVRRGSPEDAARLGEAFVATQPDNQAIWCVLATAWRMTGDPRHGWLVEQPGLVSTVELDTEDTAIDALAAFLRDMHVARAHPFDQSLRGGTQTGGFLLRRKDPEIRLIRHALTCAMRKHINQLPPRDARHPLLKHRRDAFHFTDSWSVRLLDGGWHISHCHSRGSLSAALYITLPPPCPGDPHAGWLTIGEPPEDLKTQLEPLRMIEPRVGRLAVFPSYLWHGTRPFPKGERMTIAFDTLFGPPPVGEAAKPASS